MQSLKVVVLGDENVGKTAFLLGFTMSCFSADYVPTVSDNYSYLFDHAGSKISLSFWEAGGSDAAQTQSLFNSSQIFQATDIFLIFYSVTTPASIKTVETKWLQQIKQYVPEPVFFLIGSKTDLREESSLTNEQGQDIAKQMGAHGFFEISAKKYDYSREIFGDILKTYFHIKQERGHRGRCWMCLDQIPPQESNPCDGACGRVYCGDCIEIWEDNFKCCYECGKFERGNREKEGKTVVVIKPRLAEGCPINFENPTKEGPKES